MLTSTDFFSDTTVGALYVYCREKRKEESFTVGWKMDTLLLEKKVSEGGGGVFENPDRKGRLRIGAFSKDMCDSKLVMTISPATIGISPLLRLLLM